VQRVVLPPRSPNLNAYAERWVQSVEDEVLSRLILLSEHSLRHALTQDEVHDYAERRHQGKSNIILLPAAAPEGSLKALSGVGNGWAGPSYLIIMPSTRPHEACGCRRSPWTKALRPIVHGKDRGHTPH
jgi:hypothetical protein